LIDLTIDGLAFSKSTAEIHLGINAGSSAGGANIP